MASGPHLWKCSRIRSSLTLSGRLPTQRCRVSLTILHKTANPHYNPRVGRLVGRFNSSKILTSLNWTNRPKKKEGCGEKKKPLLSDCSFGGERERVGVDLQLTVMFGSTSFSLLLLLSLAGKQGHHVHRNSPLVYNCGQLIEFCCRLSQSVKQLIGSRVVISIRIVPSCF